MSEERASHFRLGFEVLAPGPVGDFTQWRARIGGFHPLAIEAAAAEIGPVFALPTPMRKHQKIVLCLLAALSGVPFFVQADRAEPQRLSAVEPVLAAPVEAPLTLLAALPAREGMAELRVDPFSRERQGQRASVRRPTVPAVPAVTVAPPNPYRFAGEVRQSGVTRRFLVRGNDIVEVCEGDILNDGYRVDAVAKNEVVLVHIATGVRHVLAQKTT